MQNYSSDCSPDRLEAKIRRLYKNKKYLNIITLSEIYNSMLASCRLDTCFFSYTISSLTYIALSHFALENYKKSLSFFREIETRHHEFLKIKRVLQKSIQLKNKERALNGIKHELYAFNTKNRIKFYINYAYTLYKVKEKDNKKQKILYDLAIYYYNKALLLKKYISTSQFIQCLIGIAEVKYISNSLKIDVSENLKREYKDIENILILQETSFDVYLALGKIKYFMQEYDNALIYVQKALELVSKDEVKRIYAYDWISRISYKTKQYSTASIFYEKIIDELVNFPDQQQEEIHPRPKLYKMVQFLNETKIYLAKEETSKLSKSIWAGIIVTSLFELLNCKQCYGYSPLTCVLIGLCLFILIYIILHTEIRFTDFLNKNFPTFSKVIRMAFQKLL